MIPVHVKWRSCSLTFRVSRAKTAQKTAIPGRFLMVSGVFSDILLTDLQNMVDWDVSSRKPWSFAAALLSMGQICGGCDLRSLPKSPPRDLYPLLSNMAIESAPQIMVQWENHPEVGNLQLLKHPKKEYKRAKKSLALLLNIEYTLVETLVLCWICSLRIPKNSGEWQHLEYSG